MELVVLHPEAAPVARLQMLRHLMTVDSEVTRQALLSGLHVGPQAARTSCGLVTKLGATL